LPANVAWIPLAYLGTAAGKEADHRDGRYLSFSPPSTLHLMNEPAENSDGAVRRIGRPFQPGQSSNPGGRPKGVARAFRDVLGARLLRPPRACWRLRAPGSETQIGLRLGRSYLTEAGERLRRSPASRELTHSSRTRSLRRSERSRSSWSESESETRARELPPVCLPHPLTANPRTGGNPNEQRYPRLRCFDCLRAW